MNRLMNSEFTSSNSQTDWERLEAMTDEEIDFSDCPEITPEMFAKAIVRRGLPDTRPALTEMYDNYPLKRKFESNNYE
jgi:hypothetical protein